MSLLPTSSMANTGTAYYETVTMVDELEKTIAALREKIAMMETTISALTVTLQTNNAVTQLATQNNEILGVLREVRGSFGPLNTWLHRNKWV